MAELTLCKNTIVSRITTALLTFAFPMFCIYITIETIMKLVDSSIAFVFFSSLLANQHREIYNIHVIRWDVCQTIL
ncbi:hypothetical protein DMJ13_21035 [halophilic archaeon]|nr:hypothetical protein DMJ13_21035 [halophilic archaeon]